VFVIAHSELLKVLFWALSVTFFVYEISREPLKGLRQIHREDVFGQLLERVSMSRSTVKVTRDKKTTFFGPFGGLRAVYVW